MAIMVRLQAIRVVALHPGDVCRWICVALPENLFVKCRIHTRTWKSGFIIGPASIHNYYDYDYYTIIPVITGMYKRWPSQGLASRWTLFGPSCPKSDR